MRQLRTVQDISLPGRATRLDYQSLDPNSNQLFIAHLGDSSVIVFDVAKRRVIATIPNVARVHGVLAVPEMGRLFASATGTNEVAVIDARSLGIIARIPAGVYPDGIAYEPRTKRIFISDEHGKTVTVGDPTHNNRIATIALGGEVGNTQYDPGTGHIFSAEQTNNELVEIDPLKASIVRRTALPGCQGSHGVFIDAPSRVAFIACEDNARLISLDLDARKVIQDLPVGESPDVLGFDATRKLLYVACESGFVSVFLEAAGTLHPLLNTFVAPAAHTIALDQRTHLLYLPLENVGGHPVLRIMEYQ